MVLLVVGIPAASVIAGIGLLVIAVTNSREDQVIDRVQRTAQIQVSNLDADMQARDLGLTGVLQVNAEGVRLLPGAGRWPREAALRLRLVHPVDGSGDRVLELRPDATGWQAPGPIDRSHAWQLQLESAQGWRLVGRLPRDATAVHLGPTLTAE